MIAGINFVFVANRQHFKLNESNPSKAAEDPKEIPLKTLKNKISTICCWNNSNRQKKNANTSPKNN